ncbi:MAG: hypothetical protein V3W44_07830 [Dehalococcoidales bacterium]
MNDLSPKADIGIGEIQVTAQYDDEGKPIAFDYSWHGDDIIRIHFDFLEKSDPTHVEWDREKSVEKVTTGDIIKIGPYITEVINVDFEQEIVHCRRAHEKEEAVNDK